MDKAKTIKVSLRNLPRVAFIHQIDEDNAIEIKGDAYVEYDEDGKPVFMVDGHEVSLKETYTCEVIDESDEPGKQIAVQLPTLPNKMYWYDAHDCDGKTEPKKGWYLHPNQVL